MPVARRLLSILARQKASVEINSRQYPTDDFTNVTPKVLSYLNRNLHLQKRHPLSLVRQAIVDHFHRSYVNSFSVHDRLSPVVTPAQNFDSLLVPPDHPSRSKTDCYYVNRDALLRAHTTAHQSDLIRAGLDNFIVVGEVYRRDAIDSTHFPVFHQLDAVRSQTREQLFPDRPDLRLFERNRHAPEAVKVMEYQLKHALVGMIEHLFGENVDYRWVDAYFPFTEPSWELEVYYRDDWMEVLGCGIVRNEIMLRAGSADSIAYAFGLGLERIAMALYDIPDIRLFWSRDSGFLGQFEDPEPGKIIKYRPVSVYPQCCNDISFFLPEKAGRDDFADNDFYDLAREVGGDVVEQVRLVDVFAHPKTGRTSLTYKIVYRHMERTLKKEEVNRVHSKICKSAEKTFDVTIR